jgi:hypothetical protein
LKLQIVATAADGAGANIAGISATGGIDLAAVTHGGRRPTVALHHQATEAPQLLQNERSHTRQWQQGMDSCVSE